MAEMVDAADMSRDEIRRELADLSQQLVDESDPHVRQTLTTRRQALRAEVKRVPLTEAELGSLRRQMVGLQAEVDRLRANRPTLAAMNHGGDAGSGMAEAQAFVWEYDTNSGLAEAERRLADLHQRLASRD